MPYAAFKRQPVSPQAKPLSQPISRPAPTGGWVSAKSRAGGTPLQLYGPPAERLDGFFPTSTGITIMGGSQKVATVSATGEPCESLFVYLAGSVEEMFASSDGSIFDISAPASTTVPPAADVTGQTSDYYSTVNYSTSGGAFLYAVNGTDSPQLYSGAAWLAITGVSVPAITGVTTSTLSQVNVYRNRLFFVQGGSMNVWALPASALGGAAIQISLSGVFQQGGSVLFTATWSQDSGAGLDDTLVIVSTEGEAAIYSGSDPSNPNDWSLTGLYSLPKPMGKNGWRKQGGELLILTDQGEIPVSAAVRVDKDELPQYAKSRNIGPDWVKEAGQRNSIPWEVVSWPNKEREIITNPVTGELSVTPPQVMIRNTTTGAWCERSGWAARCLCFFNDFVYFGTNDGTVIQIEITGADEGDIYYPTCVLSWDQLGAPGFQKTVVAMRATFVLDSQIAVRLSVSTDYEIYLPTAPNVLADNTPPGVWDIGVWDVSLWDAGPVLQAVTTKWEQVNLSGYSHALQLQLSIGNTTFPTGELLQLDALVEAGEIMVG